MKRLSFEILGNPVPQPRPRATVMKVAGRPTARVYQDKRHPVNLWKLLVRDAFAANARGVRFRCPVSIRLDFRMSRPKTMVWKSKPMPRAWDTRKGGKYGGDVDNLAKSVLDALTDCGCWDDDAQVVGLIVTKVIAAGSEEPGVSVSITEVRPTPL